MSRDIVHRAVQGLDSFLGGHAERMIVWRDDEPRFPAWVLHARHVPAFFPTREVRTYFLEQRFDRVAIRYRELFVLQSDLFTWDIERFASEGVPPNGYAGALTAYEHLAHAVRRMQVPGVNGR